MMMHEKFNIDIIDSPDMGAVEWLVKWMAQNEYLLDDLMMQGIAEAKSIQEHMVRHAYNHGWDDRHCNVKASFDKNADKKFYNDRYNKQ